MILIQVTHFRTGGSFKLASKYFPVSYMASDSTAILIRCSCPLQIQSTHMDPHCHYLILQCVYMSCPITLMNVHSPNSDQIMFLTEAFEQLQRFSQLFAVVVGDFNAILSPTQDRISLFKTKLPLPTQSLSTSFRKLTRAHHLFDTWQIKHPTSKQFLFYSPL